MQTTVPGRVLQVYSYSRQIAIPGRLLQFYYSSVANSRALRALRLYSSKQLAVLQLFQANSSGPAIPGKQLLQQFSNYSMQFCVFSPFLLQVYSKTIILTAFLKLFQANSYTRPLTAVLHLFRHSYCIFAANMQYEQTHNQKTTETKTYNHNLQSTQNIRSKNTLTTYNP